VGSEKTVSAFSSISELLKPAPVILNLGLINPFPTAVSTILE
jgi:hypothetical protein